ncbi:PepSY domain-containing protein [Rhizobium sp. KVB221]|uniref:PepSY domain-containing protein n=1 Tax=Rhizobium setariae TaxID=2801340 RepID=A0A937CNE6_9HYPH|nr:PepSY domain-containing protein [Rhizobium setariae]MBL0375410.1 PepSY domain-containing protein [Rhizobium setariae]
MKMILIAAALLSAASMHAVAQTSQTTADIKTPAVVNPDTVSANAPVEGENSFTEAQAKDRITQGGYSDVRALKLDDKGVWRGTAMKDGQSMAVGLDYQGNVVAQ